MDDQELGKSGAVLTLFGALSGYVHVRVRVCMRAYVCANAACLCAADWF